MLLELAVFDFAIIEELHLQFDPGFNVLTGETGAGKSIVIDAVNTLLGGKAGPDLVRVGRDSARVEGIFTLPLIEDSETDLAVLLEALDAKGDDGFLILSRELHRAGRSVARVNGRAVPMNILQQVGKALVDLHGQGDQLSLLRVKHHAWLLDRYGGLLDRRAMVAGAGAELRRVRQEIRSLLRDEREIARRVEMLRFQVDEILTASLRLGEEEELRSERLLLNNAELRSVATDAAYRLLSGSGRDDSTVLDSINQTIAHLSQVVKFDPALEPPLRSLQEAGYQLEDVAAFLRSYRDEVEFNPDRLAQIEERLDLINRLKRKYGASIEEIEFYQEEASAELAAIGNGEQRLADLRAAEHDLSTKLRRFAEDLSVDRQQTAVLLSAGVERELSELSMAKTSFSVDFRRIEAADGLILSDGRAYAWDTSGIDQIEFLISPNQGEPLRPLAKIASGGETSRLMLALKNVLAHADPVPTLIFDEIDAGIGGRTGQLVGAKLWALSAAHQVLCVTHLPQIASYADSHFSIAKTQRDGRTVTKVVGLMNDERVAELALMLGGIAESSTARDNARDLLEHAATWKKGAHGKMPAAVRHG